MDFRMRWDICKGGKGLKRHHENTPQRIRFHWHHSNMSGLSELPAGCSQNIKRDGIRGGYSDWFPHTSSLHISPSPDSKPLDNFHGGGGGASILDKLKSKVCNTNF